MSYIVGAVLIAIALVLFIFTGVWGGLVWIVIAGIAVVAMVAFGGSTRTMGRTNPEPTGVPRSKTGSGTANERVRD